MSDHASITERAMLIALTIRVWGATKIDRSASRATAKAHKADERAITVIKRLIPKAVIDTVACIATEARTYHYLVTVPWTYKGVAMLTNSMFMEYSTKMRAFRDRFDEAVEQLVETYESLKADAKKSQGDLYVEREMPSAQSLRCLYGFSVQVMPLPDSGDFRVDLSNEIVEEIRASLSKQLTEGARAARDLVLARLRAALQHAADALNGRGGFHDTTIENVLTMADLTPKMIISPDPALVKICADIQADFSAFNLPAVRRRSRAKRITSKPTARGLVAQAAGMSLNALDVYLRGKS